MVGHVTDWFISVEWAAAGGGGGLIYDLLTECSKFSLDERPGKWP